MRSLQQLIHEGLIASPSKHIVEVSGIKGAEASGIKGAEVSGINGDGTWAMRIRIGGARDIQRERCGECDLLRCKFVHFEVVDLLTCNTVDVRILRLSIC